MKLYMSLRFLSAYTVLTSLFPLPGITDSLDLRYTELKTYGGLASFCVSNPKVDECMFAIGDWKPLQLEKIKNSSIQCIDVCPLDIFGFVRSSDGQREYASVATKDFDAGSPSRGVAFKLFPIAVEILKYEGCAGCPLIQTSPISAYLLISSGKVELPLIGYGVFYLPQAARKVMVANGLSELPGTVEIEFANSKEIRTLSGKSLSQYAKMTATLNYHSFK